MLHRFRIALSDVDRGVYEELDLRVARHPSESARWLVTRVLAYCMHYDPRLSFANVSNGDVPPLAIPRAGAKMELAIELGSMTPDRLRAWSRRAERVVVVSVGGDVDPAALPRNVEVLVVAPSLVAGLEAALGRDVRWDLSVNEGHVYVTTSGKSFDAPAPRVRAA